MGRKAIDLTGQIINGIIVNSMVEEDGKSGKHKKWYCTCPVCKEDFIVASQHLRGKEPISMCAKCNRKQYDDLSGMQFGRLYVLERNWASKNKRITYRCKCQCGSIVDVQANHLIGQEIQSCGCLLSSGEEQIANYLLENNIQFERQKRFDNCVSKSSLRFDFYIPEYNLVIEYQGIQHFYAVKFFGGEDALVSLKTRDQIKRDYCIENNIKYYTIDYNENIELSILNILSNEDIV